MADLDPDLRQAAHAGDEGRYDDALRCLLAVTGRLMTGDFACAFERNFRRTRFHLVVDMNEMQDDGHATWALFVRLEALAPEQARREAFLALPAIVAAGDFERAERYLPRAPLDRLG